MKLITDIILPENDIETLVISNDEFIKGVFYGKSRMGHPEGEVIYHIKEVLNNIDKFYHDDINREKLRIIAILHDSFKFMVNNKLPKSGENHHGTISRRFAEKYLNLSDDVLYIIQHHDDAYNAWSIGNKHNDWIKAKKRAENLIQGLLIENCLDLFLKFYYCDNTTGNKSNDDYIWFKSLIK